MNSYEKIDNSICPECDFKLFFNDGEQECLQCGIGFKFVDDMGPGSYSRSTLVGGKSWLFEELDDASDVIKSLSKTINDIRRDMKKYDMTPALVDKSISIEKDRCLELASKALCSSCRENIPKSVNTDNGLYFHENDSSSCNASAVLIAINS